MESMVLALTRADVREWLGDHGTAVIGTLVLAIVGSWVVRIIVPRALRPAVERQMVGRPDVEVDRRADTLANVIVRTAELIFVTLAVFTILPEFGFDIRAVLAGVSITAVAIGLGTQSLVRDWVNGIFILSENQYGRGDIVTIAGVTGAVEDVTLRRTVLRDFDGVLYSVPNGTVAVSANYTRGLSRVRVTVPVQATSDLVKVREVVDAVGQELASDGEWADRIIEAPRFLRVDQIDMNGVAVQVNGAVRPGSQWEVAGALRVRLLEAFRREGIKTPWG